MSELKNSWKLVPSQETQAEPVVGRTHYWHCKPGLVADSSLLFVRVQVLPGQGHQFHKHPHMEEILYVLSGTAEQWLEKTRTTMKPGDSVHIPADVVHAT